jgi:hypothetical protein
MHLKFVAVAAAMAAFSSAAHAAEPPSLDDAVKAIRSVRLCGSFSHPNSPLADGEPVLLERCTPALPAAWLYDLKGLKIEASCGVVFDLDDQGQPIFPETMCDVAKVQGELTKPWRTYLEATLGMAATRGAIGSRFAARGAVNEKRTDLFMVFSFEFDVGNASLPPIAEFKRTRPRS